MEFGLVIGKLRLPWDFPMSSPELQDQLAKAERSGFSFRFTYRHIALAARLRPEKKELSLQGKLGPMPFSAESAVARAQLQAVLDAANQHLGQTFRVIDGWIWLDGHQPIPGPVSAASLVAAIVMFLLPRKAYLQTIELFLHPPRPAFLEQGGSTLRREGRRR